MTRRIKPIRPAPARRPAGLRARLADAEEALRAIRGGEVDSVRVVDEGGSRVFTLDGAGHAYRMLIESMNEGALTITGDKTILYANRCFARMVQCPLERVIGGSLRRFLSVADRAMLRPLLKRAAKEGSKIAAFLRADDGTRLPAQISIRPLARNGPDHALFGIVVTDMTAARRTEELLRMLANRVVQAQETERGHLALELHDHITQLLCALLYRSQTLADKLSAHDGPARKEALKLRGLLGQAAAEVERISDNLRPSILDQLGLAAVLRDASTKFTKRTGVTVKLACVQLTVRPPADAELTFYRILQEALKNVERHARAAHVTVALTQHRGIVQLAIRDDGIGFDADRHPSGRKRRGGLGLLGMRERATFAGGGFEIRSVRHGGTDIKVRIPLGNIAGGIAGGDR